ncbi:MAG: hypothetical protein J7L23_04500 [Candidatus Diapherotrites archaeon]|nr:hypothetical protein [Candidatus Diapherotrites archaeon]
MEKEKKFCPVCGSTELIYGILGTTANYYECKNCGYRGPIIIQDGRLAEKLKDRYEKKNQKHL